MPSSPFLSEPFVLAMVPTECLVSLSLQWRMDLQWYLREVYWVLSNHVPWGVGVGQCCLVGGK